MCCCFLDRIGLVLAEALRKQSYRKTSIPVGLRVAEAPVRGGRGGLWQPLGPTTIQGGGGVLS